jgi:hypothetical protein
MNIIAARVPVRDMRDEPPSASKAVVNGHVPERSAERYPPSRCGSCGLILSVGPHGTNRDCLDALNTEVSILKRIVGRA